MMECVNFNNRTNTRWKKKPPLRSPSSLLPITLPFRLVSLLLFLFYKNISNSLLSTLKNSPQPQSLHLCTSQQTLAGEKFLWYAPNSGFNNQLSKFKYVILMATILNRTLIVPPILDHHAIVLGSCPKFRVLSPNQLRFAVWNHTIEFIQSRRQSVKTSMESHDFFTVNPQTETQTNKPLPDPPALDEECESMDSTNSNDGEQPVLQKLDASQHCYPVMYPAYITQILPFFVPFWPGGHSTEAAKIEETHEVLKPIAVRSKSPINVDKLVRISKFSIGESLGDAAPFLGNLKT